MYKDYFKRQKDGSVLFIGDKLEIEIPERFEKIGWLELEEVVKCIGIFTMTINDSIKVGYNFQATIETIPSDIITKNIDGNNMVYLIYKKNDVFLVSEEYIPKSANVGNLFNEFIKVGNVPKWLSFNNAIKLFENTEELLNINFNSDRLSFEMMLMYCYRDKDNPMLLYKDTEQKSEPVFVPVGRPYHAAMTSLSRIGGNYASLGEDASLANPTSNTSELESLLRD